MEQPVYLCVDLKSFYASVECVERNLDPMTTNLVVADASRTEKTICLAATPSLKAYGIPGRARLFEVVQKVREINAERKRKAPGGTFTGESYDMRALQQNPSLALTYIVASPRMAHYMRYSTDIYQVYLKYAAPEDIHVYSIDEVFMDMTGYLKLYRLSPRELAVKILKDVRKTTGMTATAGLGTNLYLAKVAMDIVAKHMPEASDGTRIAELDEIAYRRLLWGHRPLTDFWRIGRGYAQKLEANGLYTMGDIARYSLSPYGESKLYKLFGINAELLIDHAWGREPCTMADIKAYRPEHKSLCSGQVLSCPYDFDKARLIVREMAEGMALDLVEKRLVTDQLVLTVGYDAENLKHPGCRYTGEVTADAYGRRIPKHGHGTFHTGSPTSSAREITRGILTLYDRIADPHLTVRRLTLSANHLVEETDVLSQPTERQMNLFTDYGDPESQQREQALKRERILQETVIGLKQKFGKNAVLKGTSLQEGTTAMDRNRQIGGHRA